MGLIYLILFIVIVTVAWFLFRGPDYDKFEEMRKSAFEDGIRWHQAKIKSMTESEVIIYRRDLKNGTRQDP